ncbi:MAG: methyltransferase [Bryobacterales bacterium]
MGSRSFFQVNRFLADRLAQAAVSGYEGKTALDLYSGVGLLTLPLARTFEATIGVDSSGAAVRSLQFNAERAGVEAKVVHLNVNEYLRSFDQPVDLIVADPPRAG